MTTASSITALMVLFALHVASAFMAWSVVIAGVVMGLVLRNSWAYLVGGLLAAALFALFRLRLIADALTQEQLASWSVAAVIAGMIWVFFTRSAISFFSRVRGAA